MTTDHRQILLRPFTPAGLAAVLPWFDDPETLRWLGGRDWPESLLRLIADPRRDHRGSTVRERAGWIATLGVEDVALIDTEIYADGTAAVAIVVAPEHRRQGIGAATLVATGELLVRGYGVQFLVGGVEESNAASARCVKAAGFIASTETPDAEGFIEYVLRLDETEADSAAAR
jgi:RimJ/RimL family protein N-acetyltransferase